VLAQYLEHFTLPYFLAPEYKDCVFIYGMHREWKRLVDQWMNTPEEMAGTEGTPESLNLSVIDEEEAFPSPPHDLDIYAPEPNGFELSQVY
jgi:hypothetical protein